MRLPACSAPFLALVAAVLANTEKAIFVAPAALRHSDSLPGLSDLLLESITPDERPNLRIALPVAFPTESQPRGLDSWYLLDNLHEGQRYEIRLCWAAVQPTEFWIDVHDIVHVFDTPLLIQSLASFSENQKSGGPKQLRHINQRVDTSSTLFLHVHAAADYFTANQTLMQYPPPVNVELILDPYIGNIFPRSLLPTAGYIAILAIVSWYLSGIVWRFLQSTEDDANSAADSVAAVSATTADSQQTLATTTPRHPFYTLPAELILDIVDLLPPEAFINFVFANYPLVHSHGLAPALSRPRILYITTQTQIPTLFPLVRMPPEILLHIMRNLKPIDMMRFALANYQDLARNGIAPPLTGETIKQLRNAVRRTGLLE